MPNRLPTSARLPRDSQRVGGRTLRLPVRRSKRSRDRKFVSWARKEVGSWAYEKVSTRGPSNFINGIQTMGDGMRQPTPSFRRAIAGILALAILGLVTTSTAKASVVDGDIETFAGTGTRGYSGDGGPALGAQVDPRAIAADSSGNTYVADGSTVRKIDPTGTIDRFAGTGTLGFSGDGGPAVDADMEAGLLAVDALGDVFVVGGGRIRRIDTQGVIQTVAGVGDCDPYAEPVSNRALDACLGGLSGFTVDAAGSLYLSNWSGGTVRRVTPDGVIERFAGGGSTAGNGDGGPALDAKLIYPGGLVAAADGSLYIADLWGSVRRVDAGGVISTIAGGAPNGYYPGDGHQATEVFVFPFWLALDRSDHLFISGPYSSQVSLVELNTGVFRVVAGGEQLGYSGDGGPARESSLRYPGSLAVTASDDLLLADYGNARVREVFRRATTILNAHPIVGSVSTQGVAPGPASVSATLTLRTGSPISNKMVTFTAGDGTFVCNDVTDESGSASCLPSDPTVGARLVGGQFTARFAGDDDLRPSSSRGDVVNVEVPNPNPSSLPKSVQADLYGFGGGTTDIQNGVYLSWYAGARACFGCGTQSRAVAGGVEFLTFANGGYHVIEGGPTSVKYLPHEDRYVLDASEDGCLIHLETGPAMTRNQAAVVWGGSSGKWVGAGTDGSPDGTWAGTGETPYSSFFGFGNTGEYRSYSGTVCGVGINDAPGGTFKGADAGTW